MFDTLIIAADNALRTLSGSSVAARPMPVDSAGSPEDLPLAEAERALSGALMRVNHVGEVCAQALYQAQAMSTRDPLLRRHFEQASRDETDHLAWTRERLAELGARPSLLNPIWYAGAFGIGLIAGRAGDTTSLGFVVETERQVERHLAGHLDRLPVADGRSRAIVAQMKEEEARHATQAEEAGAQRLPAPARWLMRAVAKVMTGTARYV